jgi:hypothetical protein
MEIDLHATSLAALEEAVRHVLDHGWSALAGALGAGSREVAAWGRLVGATAGQLESASLRGLRLGHDTCEFRVPGQADFEAARALADWLGLRFTAVLPPTYAVREIEVARLLDSLPPGTLVACADWGTIEMVRKRPGLVPQPGHAMNRMWRFERWARTAPAPDVSGLPGADAATVFRGQRSLTRRCPLLDPPAGRLASFGEIGGIELDPVPQGVEVPPGIEVPILIHAPWTYVTMGRRCVTRSLVEGGGPVRLDPCPKPCLDRLIVARYDVPTALLLQKGNAVYVENTSFLAAVPVEVRERARWVLTPLP